MLLSLVRVIEVLVEGIRSVLRALFLRSEVRAISSNVPSYCEYVAHPALSASFASGYLQTAAVLVKDAALWGRVVFSHRSHCVTSDGARLSLHWSSPPSEHLSMPVVLLVPGLTGDHSSSYLRTMCHCLTQRGFLVVTSPARGVGLSTLGNMDQGYNARFSGDCIHLVRHVRSCVPNASHLFAVGFSLGANILCNALADVPTLPLDAAVLIGSPWYLPATNARVNRTVPSLLFSGSLTSGLVTFLRDNEATLRKSARASSCDFQRGLRSRSVLEFDTCITAPFSGYESAQAYYESASSSYRLHKTRVPILSIDALDDPICDARSVPKEALPPKFCSLQVAQGGHLGYIEWTGFNLDFLRASWCDRMAAEYFERHVAGK